MISRQTQVAVVGATGVVGREVLAGLQELGHPPERISALASDRSEAVEVDFADETIQVEKATPESFRGMHLVFFATPADVSRQLAPAAQQAGAWVVDASSAFRDDPQIPLVLGPFNLEVLKRPFKGRIVSCPSAPTSALVTALTPLRQAFGLHQVLATVLLGASSAGIRGVKELEAQTAGLLSGKETEAQAFPHRLAFNLIPQVGEARMDTPWMGEEDSLRRETRRLWGLDAPEVAATAILVPTFFGHALSLAVKLARPVSLEDATAVLRAAPGIKLLDTPSERVYPMPMLVMADPSVHIGRLRVTPGEPDRLLLFVTIDNAGRGAALNLLEAGQALLSRGS